MKITLRWLKSKSACPEGIAWFNAQKERDSKKLIVKLMAEKHFDWASWLIVQVMERPQYLAYTIYAAEQVIDIYEKKYPTDKRPRNAIEAVKKCLTDDSAENRNAAADAAYAAYAAAAYAAVREEMQTKILNYGLTLLK